MITHTIITHKPRIEVKPVVSLPFNNPNWPHAPHNKRKFTDKAAFDEWLKETTLSVGTIVTMLPISHRVHSLPQVHLIIEENRDFDKMEWQQHTGEPKVFRFVQISKDGPGLAADWIRWDGLNGYRELTSEEFNTVVYPNRDLLSNYHKSYVRPAAQNTE